MANQTVLAVGANQQYATIGAAIAAANAMGGNADIQISAGTYVNDGGYLWTGIDNVTIEGVGGMAVIRDPQFNAGGKAAIVVGGQNIVLRNLDISGVTVPDGNGAAVRYDRGTLLLDHVHFHDNQNGFLGAGDATGSITIQDSEFDGNGTSAGTTHNIYVGDVATFTLTRSYIHDANVGHEVKSRAETNVITGNYILDNGSTSSYSIDLPNGGNAVITGNLIQQGVNSGNHTINAYGEEGNLHAGTTLIFSNNVVVNDDANGAGPVWNSSGRAITGGGNSVWNTTNLGSGLANASVTPLTSRPGIDVSALYAAQAAAQNGPGSGSPPIVSTCRTPRALRRRWSRRWRSRRGGAADVPLLRHGAWHPVPDHQRGGTGHADRRASGIHLRGTRDERGGAGYQRCQRRAGVPLLQHGGRHAFLHHQRRGARRDRGDPAGPDRRTGQLRRTPAAAGRRHRRVPLLRQPGRNPLLYPGRGRGHGDRRRQPAHGQRGDRLLRAGIAEARQSGRRSRSEPPE